MDPSNHEVTVLCQILSQVDRPPGCNICYLGSGSRPASYHIVKYDLSPQGDQTRVTLSQFNEGEDKSVDAKTKAEFEKNWTMMLNGLKQTVEGAH